MNSCSWTPVPVPNSTRPRDSWSSMATSWARRSGLYSGSCHIMAPTRRRLVARATAVRYTLGALVPIGAFWCSMTKYECQQSSSSDTRADTTISARDHVLLADDARVLDESVGHQSRMLDQVGAVADDAGHERLAFGELDLL